MGIKSEGAVPNAWIYVDVKNVDVGTYVQMAMRAVNDAIASGANQSAAAATISSGAANTNTCCAPSNA